MPPPNGVDLDSTSGVPNSTHFYDGKNKVDIFHQDKAQQPISAPTPATAPDPKPVRARRPGSFGVGPHGLQCGLQYIISFFLKTCLGPGARECRRRPAPSGNGDRHVNRWTTQKAAKTGSRENDWQPHRPQTRNTGASRSDETETTQCGTPIAPCNTARGKTVGAHRDMMQRSKIVFHSPPPPQGPDTEATGKQTGKRLPEAECDAMTGALSAPHIHKLLEEK